MESETNKSVAIKTAQESGFFHILGLVSSDKKYVFIAQRTQKLVAALYLITGFFSDNEPLKWKLRSLGQALISTALSLKDASGEGEAGALRVRNLTLEITSFLLIAKQASLISEMNYTIISREFSSLMNAVPVSEALEFNELKWEEGEQGREPQREIQKDRIIDSPKLTHTTEAPKDQRINENTIARIGYASKKPETKAFKEFGVVAVKKNSRQSIIISLLKRKKEIMIKDVSPLIEGCSEKTIQRELLAMVRLGILHKAGEKRWSRYSLA